MDFLRYSKIYLILSVLLVTGSAGSLIGFGLDFGIDFTGGSILEFEYAVSRPANQEIHQKLAELQLGSLSIQPIGENGILLRLKDIAEETHQGILQRLGEGEEKRFESIGPAIGKELKAKAAFMILVALLAIFVYVALAFRRIAHPLKAWHWSVASLVALGLDLFLPLGMLAFLGRFQGIEITIPIVVALLTIVGYSINNVIVVFDRVRENMTKRFGVGLKDTVNKSLRQTVSRNFNTSLTTLLPLCAIFFFGGETLGSFALVLIVGIATGIYSSLFLAPAALVWLGSKRGRT